MSTNESQDDKSPSEQIDARIEELGDEGDEIDEEGLKALVGGAVAVNKSKSRS